MNSQPVTSELWQGTCPPNKGNLWNSQRLWGSEVPQKYLRYAVGSLQTRPPYSSTSFYLFAEASAEGGQKAKTVAIMRYADNKELLPKRVAADGECCFTQIRGFLRDRVCRAQGNPDRANSGVMSAALLLHDLFYFNPSSNRPPSFPLPSIPVKESLIPEKLHSFLHILKIKLLWTLYPLHSVGKDCCSVLESMSYHFFLIWIQLRWILRFWDMRSSERIFHHSSEMSLLLTTLELCVLLTHCSIISMLQYPLI